MITINNQSYEYLGKNNQFRNNKTHEIFDGDNIPFQNGKILFEGNLQGVSVGNRHVSLIGGISQSRKHYLKNLFPKIKKEIWKAIPLKDEKAKKQVFHCVTRYASCNYESRCQYAQYRIGEVFKAIFGKSDWQVARKEMQAEMDRTAAHSFLKSCVKKYQAAKDSC